MFSDIDIDVLVDGPPHASRPAYLADTEDRLTHLSVVVRDVASWLARLEEPADWAFGLPVSTPVRLLWATPRWRSRVDLAVVCHPAGEPRLEEFVATLGKVASATAAEDGIGARLAASDLARACPSVLRLANPPLTVASRRAALGAALDLSVAPPNYRDDMLTCLGLRPATTAGVHAAAGRLVAGTIALVRPYADQFEPVAGADLAAAVADGRLDRYVAQLAPPTWPLRARSSDSDRPGWDRATPVSPHAEQSGTVPVPEVTEGGVPTTPAAPTAPGPARPSALDPEIAARLRRTPDGLVAAVVRQHDTGEVLMLAWMDDEALHRTLTTGRATYWSRSRQEHWVKGATSGHHQYVRSVALDCDGDALLVSVDQVGPACHTGTRNCFSIELPVSVGDVPGERE